MLATVSTGTCDNINTHTNKIIYRHICLRQGLFKNNESNHGKSVHASFSSYDMYPPPSYSITLKNTTNHSIKQAIHLCMYTYLNPKP